MTKADVFVSALVVCQNQQPAIGPFVSDLCRVLEERYTNYEVVLLDNGSTDGTAGAVGKLLGGHKCVRYFRLSRRVDGDTALTAGLDTVIGDYVVTLDPVADPPEEVPAVVDRCRDGADVVVGVDRRPAPRGPLYRLGRQTFRWLYRRLLRFPVPSNWSTLRCLSRAAVNAITRVRTRRRFLAAVLSETGYTPALYPYDRRTPAGRTGLASATRAGLSVLVHHSVAPLRLVSVLGLFGSAASVLYSGYVVVLYLVKRDVMPGWTTLSLQVSGLFFLLFVMLSLIGEYLGRLLEESVDRPLYHLRDEQASAVMLAEAGRLNVLDRSDAPAEPLPR